MDHLSASLYTRITDNQIWSDLSLLKLIGIFGVVYSFSERTQRIFKYGDIQNISFTPDKELNILIYRTPSYVII